MLASLDAASRKYQDLLDGFLRPYYSLLPNYAINADECKPSELLATGWQRDRFAGYGSYSNFQVPGPRKDACRSIVRKTSSEGNNSADVAPLRNETVISVENGASPGETEDFPHLDKDIEVLRQGLPEQGVWIAGEHTAPFVALGTVTGAFWSGEAVAKRVVSWFHGIDEKGRPEIADSGGSSEMSTVQVGKGGIEGISKV